MKKTISILLIVALLTVGAFALVACNKGTSSDYEYIKNKGTLVCGITLYEPMSFADEDGEMTGFDTEFTEAVCKKLGLEPKFQVIKWNSKELELSTKSIDCIWNGLTVTEERKANMDFSTAYLKNKQCVVVKKDNLASYTSNAACSGKKAAAEKGSAGETAATELGAKITTVQAQVSALTEVLSNAVDFAVVDYTLGLSMCGKGDYANLAIAENITAAPEEYAIGFRKGSDIVEKVNAAIEELKADGTLAALAAKYGLEDLLIK